MVAVFKTIVSLLRLCQHVSVLENMTFTLTLVLITYIWPEQYFQNLIVIQLPDLEIWRLILLHQAVSKDMLSQFQSAYRVQSPYTGLTSLHFQTMSLLALDAGLVLLLQMHLFLGLIAFF